MGLGLSVGDEEWGLRLCLGLSEGRYLSFRGGCFCEGVSFWVWVSVLGFVWVSGCVLVWFLA